MWKRLRRLLGRAGGSSAGSSPAGSGGGASGGEADAPVEAPRGGNPGDAASRVVGVVGAKGGVGKSIIASSLAMVASAAYGSVLVVDMDIINATSTTLVSLGTIRDPDTPNVLEYLVEPSERVSVVRIRYPRDRTPSLPVAGEPDVGVAVGEVYLLPAKSPGVGYDALLERLGELRRRQLTEALEMLVHGVKRLADKLGVGLVVFDFPPMQPGSGRYFRDVLGAVEFMVEDRFLAVVNPDPAAVHGLAGLLTTGRFSVVGRGLAAVAVTPVSRRLMDTLRELEVFIAKTLGVRTYGIPYSPLWRAAWLANLPPVLLEPPDRPATRTLLRLFAETRLVPAGWLRRKLRAPV